MKKLLYVLFTVCLFLPGAAKGFTFSPEEKLDIKTTLEKSVDVIIEKTANTSTNADSINRKALFLYHRVNLLLAEKDQDPKSTLVFALDFLTDVANIPTGNIPRYLQNVIDEERSMVYHHLKACEKRCIENNAMIPDSLCEQIQSFENVFAKQEYQRKKKELVRTLQSFNRPIKIDSIRTLIYLGNTHFASAFGGPLEEMYAGFDTTDIYGMRIHPIHKVKKFHKGRDYPWGSGKLVRSTIDGLVVTSSYSESSGNYLKIYNEETGLMSVSLHFSKILVKKGKYVHAGEPIAKCGSTGDATGPHVHDQFDFGKESINSLAVYEAYQSDLQVLVIEYQPDGKDSKYAVDTDYNMELDNLLAVLSPIVEQQQTVMCQIQTATTDTE